MTLPSVLAWMMVLWSARLPARQAPLFSYDAEVPERALLIERMAEPSIQRSDAKPVPTAVAGAELPRIIRPVGLARAQNPVNVPNPEHAHLPGWARRVHAQAAPIFGDLLGQIEDPERSQLSSELEAVIAQISAGKFSHAWNYPRLIDRGFAAYQDQSAARNEANEARRAIENKRRQLSARLRDPSANLPTDALAKLSRALQSANQAEELASVGADIERAIGGARSSAGRRTDREIARTKARIAHTARRADAPDQTESWQDALKRLTGSDPGSDADSEA